MLAAAPLSTLPIGLYSLCPDLAELHAALEAEAGRLAAAGEVARVYAGDAAVAADDLVRWRMEGWEGMLVGGPDLARPWLIDRAGGAAERTRAAVCVATAGPAGESELSPTARLARAGTQVLMDALAADIAAHGRPTRAGVNTALAQRPFQGGLTWYQVEVGRWVAEE